MTRASKLTPADEMSQGITMLVNGFSRLTKEAWDAFASALNFATGWHSDEEYADAMMREHRTALAKQGKGRRGLDKLPKIAEGGIVQFVHPPLIHGSIQTVSESKEVQP